MTKTYQINATDSENTPAWASLCTTLRPVAQDSGRCLFRVTTEDPDALEAALDTDGDVEYYEPVSDE